MGVYHMRYLGCQKIYVDCYSLHVDCCVLYMGFASCMWAPMASVRFDTISEWIVLGPLWDVSTSVWTLATSL